jgi:uncharacterized membrane protein
METKSRSLVKAVCYRVYSSLITSGIVFAFTGKATLAFGIGVTEMCVKICTFFLHERFWALIPFGVARHPLAQFEVTKPLTEEHRLIIRAKLSELGYLPG